MATITTPITQLFNIQHPIILAGMDRASGPELVAAVTNAGGLGVIGAFGYTPKNLRLLIEDTKKRLRRKNAPFGVDLLIPQVGGNARKTNYDYTKGKLAELIDIIIEEKAALFVSAVGAPPRWVVDKLHAAGIPVMNMVGHPKHVPKVLAAGVDIVCAQAGEAGGHTGSIPASILVPACVDAVKGHKSPLTGQPIYVVGAGGIFDGRGLAANLAWGAQGVWVGTRFVATVESGVPQRHKELLVSAGHADTIRTLVYTGRPARVRLTPYLDHWHNEKQKQLEDHLAKGERVYPYPMGQVAALIHDVPYAKVIVDDMVSQATAILQRGVTLVKPQAKL